MKGRRPRPLDDGDSGRDKGIGLVMMGKTNSKSSGESLAELSATIIPMAITSTFKPFQISNAAKAIKEGNLVAFPTETVYGLGADASNQIAVAKIYEVKGRPKDHPLIVHISSAGRLDKWATKIPGYANILASEFWPGPMTLVLPKTELAQNFVTGGQDTIAIRVPSHPIAIKLLKNFERLGGQGVAAPSANRFGKVSPTTYKAVKTELGNVLSADDMILKGGKCNVGIESTIIDCTGPYPTILRPGAITNEMIIDKLGESIILNIENQNSFQIRFPGSLESHYAPNAEIHLSGTPSVGDGFIAIDSIQTPPGAIRILSPKNHKEFAVNLYESFRKSDKLGITRVFIVPPVGSGLAVAINDRLSKSAFKKH